MFALRSPAGTPEGEDVFTLLGQRLLDLRHVCGVTSECVHLCASLKVWVCTVHYVLGEGEHVLGMCWLVLGVG